MEDVAGYRVLRTAGHGTRSRLLLGFDDGRIVVLKVSAIDDPGHHREIEALDRAAGDHVVGLEDVASDGRRAVLVLERLAGGPLVELLERRGTLEAGEAVTILAPLAVTVERLHAAGVAHGGLSPAAVCFRADGAPTLTGFGRAELFAAGSPDVVLETVAGVVGDREALRGIAALVLGRVAGDRAAAAARLIERLPDASPGDLGRALFDLATPAPVAFGVGEAEPAPERVGDLRDEVAVEEGGPPVVVPPWLPALLPDGVRDRILDIVGRAAATWSGWALRRRRIVLAAAAGGLTVIAAVTLLPAEPPGTTAAAVGDPTPEASAASAETLPEDPVEAATLLLRLREQCVRDLSLLCLDDVVQPGSAAHDDDVALIRALRAGGETALGGVADGDPVLVERLGDSALLDLPSGSVPGSILLLRTTNGWRIRDYLEAPAVSSGPD